MSTLRKPLLGPIIGHTTHNSCRIWISASEQAYKTDDGDSKRSIGVLGVVDDTINDAVGEHIYYFRLHREFDRTGSFNLGADVSLWADETQRTLLTPYSLTANTKYKVRLASLILDDAMPDDYNADSEQIASKLPHPGAWKDKFNHSEGLNNIYLEATFTTQPLPQKIYKHKLSFFVGSCRYPGLLGNSKKSDEIFKPMLKNHLSNPVNFTLMIGDQIYADRLNKNISIGRADSYREFQERYHTAFGSRNMRALLSNIPTYMILDDHEIEDNWTQDRLHQKRELFILAITAYMSYQWSHGPRFEDSYIHNSGNDSDEKLKRLATINLFYDFTSSGYPFFVLDTRTQRYKGKKRLADNYLLGRPSQHESEPSQLDRVCHWLKQMQSERGNIPKFIVSSSVFVPNQIDERDGKDQESSDSWPAFPNTRKAILEAIITNNIQNVIFLCGDIHCSNISKIIFDGPGVNLTSYSIVSSAFYWPFPFADGDPADIVHDSKNPNTYDPFIISDTLGTMHYRAWAFTQDDNFCRIDVDPDLYQMKIQYFNRKGNPIETRKFDDSYNSLPEQLQLEPW